MTILAVNGDAELVVVLIFAALLGLIPAKIAWNKGQQSFAAWWLLGAALFIIALPLALLIRPDEQALERRRLAEGMKKCPYCAEFVKKEATVCKHCGRNLSATATKPVAQPSGDIHFNCPRCGQSLAVEQRGAGMAVNRPSCNEQIEIPQQVAAHSNTVSDPDESYAALRSEPNDDPNAAWRAEPATDSQKRKLRFYGRRFPAQLTKGEASELIEDAMERHPEKEESYQKWRQSEHDIADCLNQVEGSDFCEEDDMKKPTREMIQETIAFLEANRPNWRYDVRGNDLAILLMERYPQLERMRRRPR
jgi:hypothetical protein